MPQVDLETLVSVCAGGSSDRKIACETLAANGYPLPEHPPGQLESVPSDFPPESFYISKDDEVDWYDRNAFYERKESQKGNSNSNSNSTNLNPNSSTNSQRFSLNLKGKASIIGLPKPQKACFIETKNRRNCKPVNNRLFPKRPGPTTKPGPPEIEPSSPKVSCMGRVRSKRDQNRRLKNRQKLGRSETGREKSSGKRKSSFLASFRAIFRSGHKERPARENNAWLPESQLTKMATMMTHDIRSRLPPDDVDAIPLESPARRSVTRKSFESEPVGLGGMKRFASGRRSDSWADVDMP